jgi:predicted hydrocarbon binding protein
MVEVVATLRNTPGALSKASSAIAALGINVLSGFHTASPKETDAKWSFFADLPEKAEAEQLREALKGSGVVAEAKITEAQFPGLIIDEFHFPLLVLNERAIVFRLGMLAEMFRHLTEMTGLSVARVLRHQMGLEAGAAKARRVQEEFHLDGEDALRIILDERVAKGWGIPNLLRYDPAGRAALVSVTELFECAASEKKATEPRGEFFRGYLQGVLSVLMNANINVREIECIAKGHPQCSFEATIAEA